MQNKEVKFPGSHRMNGTVYSNMNCDEALQRVYAYIAKSKKTKKLNNCFAIVANHCYALDNSSTKTFNPADITSKYSDVPWDEAMDEIMNKLPRGQYLPVEVAIGIIIDTCRKVDDLDVKANHLREPEI